MDEWPVISLLAKPGVDQAGEGARRFGDVLFAVMALPERK